MSLQHKYRPIKFEDIEGNENTLALITSKLSSKDMPHAYLLTGPAGTGKTTLGRIIARELGALSDGNELNYHELDSAQFRGIDTIREIRSTFQLAPFNNEYTVYLMDECHQNTSIAQDAMLKMLEDAPTHVVFILCTSEPQKLSVAIKRRCCVLNMSLLEPEVIEGHLNWICKKEGKKIPDSILEHIAENSGGSIGVAVKYLDTIIDLPPNEIKKEMVQTDSTNKAIIDLCRLLMTKKFKWKDCLEILADLQDEDPEKIRRAVIGYCNSCLLKSDMSNAAMILNFFIECKTYDVGKPAITDTLYQIYDIQKS